MRWLLVFELALLVAWVALYIVLCTAYSQVASPDLWYTKLSMVISLLGHPGTALVLIKLDHELDKGRTKRVAWGRFFWLFGNMFTDLWSVVDSYSDLTQRAIIAAPIAIVQGFTTTALVASSAGLVVYLAVMIMQTRADDEAPEPLVEALLPPPRIVPLRARRGVVL